MELMIGLGIMGVLILTLFDAFLTAHRHQNVQERISEIQQLERISLEMIVQDLRRTGLDPTGLTNAGVAKSGNDILQLTFDLFQDLNGDGDVDDLGEAPNGALDRADEGVTYRRENVGADGLGDLTKEFGGFSFGGFNIPSDPSRPRLTIAQGVRQFVTTYDPNLQSVTVRLEIVERREDPNFLLGIDLDGDITTGTAHSRLVETTVLLRNLAF